MVPLAIPMPTWAGSVLAHFGAVFSTVSTGFWSSELSPRCGQGILGVSYGAKNLSCVTQLPVKHGNRAPSLLGASLALREVRAVLFLFDSTLGYPGEGPEWQEYVKRLEENDPTLRDLR